MQLLKQKLETLHEDQRVKDSLDAVAMPQIHVWIAALAGHGRRQCLRGNPGPKPCRLEAVLRPVEERRLVLGHTAIPSR